MSSQPGTTYGTDFEFEETGQRFYAGTGDPNGTQVGTVGDFYFRADCSMTVPAIYAKLTGTNTSTGWVAIAAGGASVVGYTITPSTGTLTLTGQASGTMGTGELVLQGNQAIVIQAHSIQPSTGTLTVDGQKIPTLLPQSGSMVLTGNQPTVVVA